MKKTLLAIALCCSPLLASAAQTPVTQIDKFNSAATKIDDVRVAANVRLAAAQSNFTEIYTALNGSPWLAQTTAPSIHNVFWLDTTGAPPTIKYWDGDSWEVAASGGDGTYTLPAASAETLGGIKVGDRLTMTDGVLSADVQTTDISGKQDTLVSGANIKTINNTSLLGSGDLIIEGGSFDITADYSPTGSWDFTGANVTGIEGSLPTLTEGQTIIGGTGGTPTAVDTEALTIADITDKFIGSGPALCADGTKGDCGLGGSAGGYVSMSTDPYSDVVCTTGQYGYVGSTAYLCTGGFWASKWTLTAHSNPSPVTYSLTITPSGFTGADKFTYNSTDYTTEQVITGLSADASFTVTPDTGRAITCAGTGLTDNTGGSYTANTDTANVVATCTSSVSGVADDFSADTAANYTATINGIAISGGEAAGSVNNARNRVIHETALGGSDHWVKASLQLATAGGSGIIVGGSSASAEATGYDIHITGATAVKLFTFSGVVGTDTGKAWVVPTMTANTYYSFEVIRTGTTIALYIDDNHITPDITDSTYTGGTFGGLSFNRTAGYSPKADNFSGGL